MLSRSRIASYSADVIKSADLKKRQKLVRQLAGWLRFNGRGRQVDYLVKEIATHLSEDGYNLVTITTANELSDAAKKSILNYLKTILGVDCQIELVENIDKNLIGGALIETPKGVLDLTVKRKLMTIIEGASI